MKKYEDKWVPYLRREGVVNNREGLCLMGMPGDDYNDGPKYALKQDVDTVEN